MITLETKMSNICWFQPLKYQDICFFGLCGLSQTGNVKTNLTKTGINQPAKSKKINRLIDYF